MYNPVIFLFAKHAYTCIEKIFKNEEQLKEDNSLLA